MECEHSPVCGSVNLHLSRVLANTSGTASTTAEDARAALSAAVEAALDDYATEMVLMWSRASDEAKAECNAMERELLKVRQERRVAIANERAAVVKYLRSVDNDVLRRWADAVEKGEHIP